jgi:hypothetical protein
MSSVASIVAAMRRAPANVRVSDACKVCEHYFGAPRQHGSSHVVYRTPWPGDPRVNLQSDKGKAKAYQVRQVLKAIDKKVEEDE